jgi:hypothetical protein
MLADNWRSTHQDTFLTVGAFILLFCSVALALENNLKAMPEISIGINCFRSTPNDSSENCPLLNQLAHGGEVQQITSQQTRELERTSLSNYEKLGSK